jgi:hypothetical protein
MPPVPGEFGMSEVEREHAKLEGEYADDKSRMLSKFL